MKFGMETQSTFYLCKIINYCRIEHATTVLKLSNDSRLRKDLPSECYKLPLSLQHICNGRLRWICQHLGRIQQEETVPVP